MTCEDYPCCGHTPLDPCDRQWYDEPEARAHAMCDHENGDCEVFGIMMDLEVY